MGIESLINNIYRMHNDELIGLAKNRFLPDEVQLALVKHPYARAKLYLAQNPGLSKECRDELWSDRTNKGYTLKGELISHGHFKHEPDKYRELYDRYPSAWTRSFWRMKKAFFGTSYSWRGCENGADYTPSDLLHKIYDRFYSSDRLGPKNFSGWSRRTDVLRLLKTKTCDINLAIKISTESDPEIRSHAFEKIVELS